jgi:hypothetical protein
MSSSSNANCPTRQHGGEHVNAVVGNRPLADAADGDYGFERASRAYQASKALRGLKSLVTELGIACDLRDKDSLYLATGPTSRTGRSRLRRSRKISGTAAR